MKKTAAALLIAAIAGSTYAQYENWQYPFKDLIPQNCMSKNSYKVDQEDGSWVFPANSDTYEKTTLKYGDIQFRYYVKDKYGGSKDRKTIYDTEGRLVHQANEVDGGRIPLTIQHFENTSYLTDGNINYISGMRYRGFQTAKTQVDYTIRFEYLLDGKLYQETCYRKTEEFKYSRVTFDTTMTTYSYDVKGRLEEKISERTGAMNKESSRYTYQDLPTGETLITENQSLIDSVGNWKRPEINPIKMYCLPNDTIIEQYDSETGELARRINASYTFDGRIADSTVYSNAYSDKTFKRRSKTIYQYEKMVVAE